MNSRISEKHSPNMQSHSQSWYGEPRKNKNKITVVQTQYLSPDDNCPILRATGDGRPDEPKIGGPCNVSNPINMLRKRRETIHSPAVIDELPHLHSIVTSTGHQLLNRPSISSNERPRSACRCPWHRSHSHGMSLLNLGLFPWPISFIRKNRDSPIWWSAS